MWILPGGHTPSTKFPMKKSLPLARIEPGHAAERLGRRKRAQRGAQQVQLDGDAFVPFCCEALGGWTQASHELLQQVARQAAAHLGEPYPVALRHLMERVSVEIVRGSAAMVERGLGFESEPCVRLWGE